MKAGFIELKLDFSEKFNNERDELGKQINKLQSREAQFIHELRKKDQLFSSLQEQLKRAQKEKNVNFINSFTPVSGLPLQSKVQCYLTIETG